MPRRLSLPVAALVALAPLHAQEKATTDSGRRVILSANGTWIYEVLPAERATSPSKFKKPVRALEQATFNKGKMVHFYDPAIWRIKTQAEPNRLTLQHKDGDGYAIIIAERLDVPLEAMKNIALTNARNADPNAVITLEEERVVNQVRVLHLQIQGTIQKIPFIYLGYYYAGKEGCIQVLTYTTQNLLEEFRGDFMDFLNGFTLAQP